MVGMVAEYLKPLMTILSLVLASSTAFASPSNSTSSCSPVYMVSFKSSDRVIDYYLDEIGSTDVAGVKMLSGKECVTSWFLGRTVILNPDHVLVIKILESSKEIQQLLNANESTQDR